MRNTTLAVFAFSFVLALPTFSVAQVERYELGRRMKQLEIEWDAHPDPAARKRAVAILPDAMNQFFTLQLGSAGRTLDEARHALDSADPAPGAVRWLDALAVVPEARLIDASKSELRVEVRAFYPVKGGTPKGATATLRIGDEKPVTVPLEKLPATVRLPLAGKRGNRRLRFETKLDDRIVSWSEQAISAIGDLSKTIETVKAAAADREKYEGTTLETATLKDRLELFRDLAAGETKETDYPIAKTNGDYPIDYLMYQSYNMAISLIADGGFTAQRNGQFWVTVPTGKDRRTPCRIFVPKGLDPKKPVPVVFALHGAGGSENLFFEGYGNGRIVAECEKRGWLLVAPRSGLAFLGGPPPVPAVLDVLAQRYPIDRGRVFLVGHSMGAAQAVELVQQSPKTFAAVAVLGGAGRVRAPEPFATLPTFIGVGSGDTLALAGAKSLKKALETSSARNVTFKEYADVEHMMIVREALPDVFAVWDALMAK
ncbi:hypothetical protein [Fimbriiglobus ruber]|uniref:Uncharacterized protein n=1 Tax=Fimbriiglobus ruber TaxID=1908690 RepID=A0A225DDD8_9BACT|nr:hypothetical protein [Fimbriiglobus ruber]OWK37654.1 hypothetical protein FRUB_06774 [Fimbriiglobus ruber]